MNKHRLITEPLRRTNVLLVLTIVLMAGQVSCKKDFLDAKPKKSLVIPNKIPDYQAILDNTDNIFNTNATGLGELATDDHYILHTTWQALQQQTERNGYLWAKDVFNGETNGDWNEAYKRILHANVVLEGIDKVEADPASMDAWNNVKGSALFFRANDLYNLAQVFCKPYDKQTAERDLGLPLKLTSDINEKIERATLEETYSRIFEDLLTAKALLPAKPAFSTRPSQAATYGLLSRIYLSISDFGPAQAYADSCLQIQDELMNYNTLDASAPQPIPLFNPEVVFHNSLVNYSCYTHYKGIPTPALYNSFQENDLREGINFRQYNGGLRFWGSYASGLFCGIATDEMYLIRAECNARRGNTAATLKDLNKLLENRYKTGTFEPLTAATADEALTLVIRERRKELPFRGLRWTDLRRLNKDPRFAVTLTRELNGQQYTLPPNDPRYVFPIPPDVIRLSGIEQNP